MTADWSDGVQPPLDVFAGRAPDIGCRPCDEEVRAALEWLTTLTDAERYGEASLT